MRFWMPDSLNCLKFPKGSGLHSSSVLSQSFCIFAQMRGKQRMLFWASQSNSPSIRRGRPRCSNKGKDVPNVLKAFMLSDAGKQQFVLLGIDRRHRKWKNGNVFVLLVHILDNNNLNISCEVFGEKCSKTQANIFGWDVCRFNSHWLFWLANLSLCSSTFDHQVSQRMTAYLIQSQQSNWRTVNGIGKAGEAIFHLFTHLNHFKHSGLRELEEFYSVQCLIKRYRL